MAKPATWQGAAIQVGGRCWAWFTGDSPHIQASAGNLATWALQIGLLAGVILTIGTLVAIMVTKAGGLGLLFAGLTLTLRAMMRIKAVATKWK